MRNLLVPTVTDCGAGMRVAIIICSLPLQAHRISPTKPQTYFLCSVPSLMKAYYDLRIHTPVSMFESEVCRPLWTFGKGGSSVGYCSSELLCLFVRGRGCTSRQGEGSWLSRSLPALLSLDFAFSCVRKREAHRLMLFAWPCIMHEMIHNLLSLVYHLQRINNGVLASCFFSICHCCLSNPVYED